MIPRRPRFLLSLLLLLGAAGVPATAQAADCQFVLGFAALAQALPQQVGSCSDNQAFAANGDAQQHTSTGGLLVWRKADNWTAFTDGYHTWVNGPAGLQQRLNTERFPWEAPAPTPTPTPAAAPSPAPSSSSPPTPSVGAGNPLTADQVASIVVPKGYPEMSQLPVSSQVACFHMAQDLAQAGLHKVIAQKDDALCPYQDDGMWPGFKQSA